MSVPAAYLGIILIWATTPLAIKWSGEGAGFLFGVAARMALGAMLCTLLMTLFAHRFSWRREAVLTYLASGLGIYGGMLPVYWAAQYIPSGLISVIFGISPIVTGIFATVWLREAALTPLRLAGVGLGLAGLALIFGTGGSLGEHAALGILGVFVAVIFHALGSVWVKAIGAHLPPLTTVTGGLLVAAPLFVLTWWLAEGAWPAVVPARTWQSIVYLGAVGSVLGFVLFYYVLQHLETSRVMLVTLITPVLALLIGQALNGERIAPVVWAGTCCILLGMAVHQWGDRLLRAKRV